jgi:N-acylneuraminate cytidylyltransferase
MNAIGVILARAGSAGLPNKHVLALLGRPVISYTFDHASAAQLLNSVVVSTDCPQVRRLAVERGLPVIDRPATLATADASVQDVMLHAMDCLESVGSPPADVWVVLYGNVPVRPAGVIDAAVELVRRSGCDSVRSFCPVGKWHPAWMSRLNGDRVEPGPGAATRSIHRRQDLDELFLHEGGVVAVSRQSLLRGRQNPADPHAFFGIDRRGIRTEIGQTVEIDHVRDLYLAEAALWQQKTELTKVA